jgi:hypothetical protein
LYVLSPLFYVADFDLIRQLVKAKKPTSDTHCPPDIKRAKGIDRKINEHVGIRDIRDSDIGGGDSSDDSVEVLNPGTSKLHSAIARRAPTPPLRRNSRLNTPELVAKLANTFNPEIQHSMHQERSQQSFQTMQLMTLTQQLRDAQAVTEALRNHLAEVERARDRTELKLELVGPVPFTGFGGNGQSSRARYVAKECPDLVRRGGKIRRETFFPAGGGCIEWFTDEEDDADKENWNPSSSSSGQSTLPSFRSSSADASGGGSGDGKGKSAARYLSPNI